MEGGRYYFPGADGEDIELDLVQTPVLQLADGGRIILTRDNALTEADLGTIRSYWRHASVVSVEPEASHGDLIDAIARIARPSVFKNKLSFTDSGIVVDIRARWVYEEPSTDGGPSRHICLMPTADQRRRVPASIVRYLARKNIIIDDTTGVRRDDDTPQMPGEASAEAAPDGEAVLPASGPRPLVKQLLKELRYPYSPDGQITFPYAGLQVKAVSNIVLRPDGNPLLIDFGEFYGDAAAALVASGFDIVHVSDTDTYPILIGKLLDALGVSYAENAAFTSVENPGKYHVRISIPGLFIPKARASKVLISTRKLPADILSFLELRDIKVLSVGGDRP